MNTLFEPEVLAVDLLEVRNIYARLFAGIGETSWNRPVKGNPAEWNLHEVTAHLVALDEDGLESIKFALRGKHYNFVGLDSRYEFNDYNRKGIDNLLDVPKPELCGRLLRLLDGAAGIACNLLPGQAEMKVSLPIYNRPVSIVEILSILIFHIGLVHSAQIAEPAGLPPLWHEFSPEFRHRVIGRATRAFSLLYRLDIGGQMRKTIVFRIDGAGGGEWYVDLSPDAPFSGEGVTVHRDLVIRMRKTDVFCQMLTHRLNIPMALISGNMKLGGDLRLFQRMGSLFSVDARPRVDNKVTYAPKPSQGWNKGA